jgi:tight adherence protein B
MNEPKWIIAISVTTFFAVLIFVAFCLPTVRSWYDNQVRLYDRVLVQQLLLDINPRIAVALAIVCVLLGAIIGYLIGSSMIIALIGAAIGYALPLLVVKHLAQKRYERLENQLVDGITTLSSGVRAGLTLVQSIELLVKNSVGPICQEFGQLLREYQMGLDLNHAMRNSASRIGSPHYRLLFTAIEMHRLRGGDTGESLDRISESIRELQRLEGKLESITAAGRKQAWLMSMMPFVLLGALYAVNPDDMSMLFTDPIGRICLMFAAAMILIGFLWIRQIMDVEM